MGKSRGPFFDSSVFGSYSSAWTCKNRNNVLHKIILPYCLHDYLIASTFFYSFASILCHNPANGCNTQRIRFIHSFAKVCIVGYSNHTATWHRCRTLSDKEYVNDTVPTTITTVWSHMKQSIQNWQNSSSNLDTCICIKMWTVWTKLHTY